MNDHRYKLILITAILILTSFTLAGCQAATAETPINQAAEAQEPAPTEPAPPTATSPPLTKTVEPSPTPVPPTETTEPTPTPPTIPEPRFDPAMAYDSESNRMIVFGGVSRVSCTSDGYAAIDESTWSLDVNSRQWTNMHPETAPVPVSGGFMAYDSESDRVILFGGYDTEIDGSGNTWAYDFNTNTWMQKADGPSPRAGVQTVYDSESDRIILFGGLTTEKCSSFSVDVNAFNDTWAYDYNSDTWTDMQPAESPPERFWHQMAYDSESDRVVLVGGVIDSDNTYDKYFVWAYDYNSNTWEKLDYVIIKSAENGGMAYDSESDRIVSIGMGEIWIYDYNVDTWVKENVVPGGILPSEEFNSFSIAYDSSLDYMVVFAGCDDSGFCSPMLNDVWLFDLNGGTWEKMEVSP